MVVTHIWLCADLPFHYQYFEIEQDEPMVPELASTLEEQIQEMWPTDHVHVFNPPRSSPKGYNVFHECEGHNPNIVLGEE